MKRGRRPVRVELAVALHRGGRRQRLDFDPAATQRLDHRRVGLEPALGPAAEDEALGEARR